MLVAIFLCNSTNSVQIANVLKKYQGESLIQIFLHEEREELVEVLAYCLMQNHFHMVLREKQEGGISKFMGKLMTAYSMYFNKKNERSGPLFTKPFKAQHVDSEAYFRWIFSYIHLNPINFLDKEWKSSKKVSDINKTKNFLNNYKFSSFYDYCVGDRPERNILSMSDLPDFLIEQNDLTDLLKNIKDSP